MAESEQALLDQLRDAHAPLPPGWWPPAPGWWVLALVLVGLVALASWLQWKKRHPHWKESALREHQRLLDMSTNPSCTGIEVISQASVLMRRVALAVQPREQVAALTDAQWLDALDRLGKTSDYSRGVGRLLTRHPYMAPGSVDADDVSRLLMLIESTIGCASSRPRQDQPHTRGVSNVRL